MEETRSRRLAPSTAAPLAERGRTSSTTSSAESLYEAAEKGDAESLKRMLAAGGPVGQKVLKRCMVAAGNGDVVRVLLGDGRLSLTSTLGKKALCTAAWNGRLDALKALLKLGFRSAEAFFGAAQFDHSSCLQALLRAGCDPDAVDKSGRTALHYVAENGNLKCVRMLLKARANVMATDPDGWTALHFAAKKGAMPCARLLINEGVDVNAFDSKGKTARDIASHYRHKNILRLLQKTAAH